LTRIEREIQISVGRLVDVVERVIMRMVCGLGSGYDLAGSG